MSSQTLRVISLRTVDAGSELTFSFPFDSIVSRLESTEGLSLTALFLKYKPVKLVEFNDGRTTSTSLLITM